VAKRQTVGAEVIYEVAERWVRAALASDDSLFTPGAAIWSLSNVTKLLDRTRGNPQLGGERDFEAKLRLQLEGAPNELHQLAAEQLALSFLMTIATGAARKRELVTEILGWSPRPVQIPAKIDKSFEYGLVNPGTAFNTRRPMQLWFISDFVRTLKTLSPEARTATLADPWATRELLFSLEMEAAQTMREGLLHLIHPDTFEAITSRADKKRLVSAFADLIGDGDANVDQKIRDVRKSLTNTYGEDFDFYRREIKERWKPDEDRNDEDEGASGSGAPATTLRDGLQAILDRSRAVMKAGPYNLNNELRALFDGVQRALEISFPVASRKPGLRLAWSVGSGIWAHVPWISLLDARETQSTREGVFVVYLFHKDMSSVFLTLDQGVERLRQNRGMTEARRLLQFRAAEVRRAIRDLADRGFALDDELDLGVQGGLGESYERGAIAYKQYDSGSLPSDAQLLEDLGDLLGAYDKYLQSSVATNIDVTKPTRPTDEEPSDRLTKLAEELLLTRPFLEDIEALVADKRQIIFYGPPGTGKTFVAKRLAYDWAKQADRVRIVQFHPSYAYEDFVEGYRPALHNGVASFELRDGPLKAIAKQALDNPAEQFVLLIDEINRGNVAKVFGELYFLLEYRDDHVRLQYSPEEHFRLPKNLWMIGTMNTADRSIASIDAALRRRFYFVGFYPDESPVKDVLRRWLELNHVELLWLADVVDRANTALADRHAAIGPSYFMRDDLSADWIDRIWRHAILPYLEDRFIGEEFAVSQFELETLRKRQIDNRE
jgi:5-methylcytosine-specific restriction protein B